MYIEIIDGDVVMDWEAVSNLTHATQVGYFGFCMCEDNEGNENPYEDCTDDLWEDLVGR